MGGRRNLVAKVFKSVMGVVWLRDSRTVYHAPGVMMEVPCFSLLLSAHEVRRLVAIACNTDSVLSMLQSMALLPSDLASSGRGVTK